MLTWQNFLHQINEGGMDYASTSLDDPELKAICDQAYRLEKAGKADMDQLMIDFSELDPYIGKNFDAHGMNKLNYWVNTANLLKMAGSMPNLHTINLKLPPEHLSAGAGIGTAGAHESGFYVLTGDYGKDLKDGLKHVICCEPLTKAGMPAVLRKRLPGVHVLGNDEFANFFNNNYKTKSKQKDPVALIQDYLSNKIKLK